MYYTYIDTFGFIFTYIVSARKNFKTRKIRVPVISNSVDLIADSA